MDIKLNKVELSTGVYVETKDITKEKFNSIINNSAKVERIYNDITLSDNNIIIYEINDTTILVTSDGYYSIYNNLEDLRLVINDYEECSINGIELLFNKNVYKEKFPLFVDDIVTNFIQSLEKRNFKNYTLKEIDGEISHYESKFLLEYVTLIGKEIISNYGGRWEMKLSNDGETWNPYLIVYEKQIDLVAYVNEDIFENNLELMESYNSIKTVIEYREK